MLECSADNVFHHYVTSLKCSVSKEAGHVNNATLHMNLLEQSCCGMRPSARSFEASSVANGTQMTSFYIYFN